MRMKKVIAWQNYQIEFIVDVSYFKLLCVAYFVVFVFSLLIIVFLIVDSELSYMNSFIAFECGFDSKAFNFECVEFFMFCLVVLFLIFDIELFLFLLWVIYPLFSFLLLFVFVLCIFIILTGIEVIIGFLD